METEARKINFYEAWQTMAVFFVDEDLEREIDNEVNNLLDIAKKEQLSEVASLTVESVADLLHRNQQILDVILRDIELSEEKFLRIISLLRRMGRIPGEFDYEWSLTKIKKKLSKESEFAYYVANLLMNGKKDAELQKLIPRYYLETLNYREMGTSSLEARRVRYKHSLIGTYGGRKGYKVEGKIREILLSVKAQNGVPFSQGRSRLVDTDIDFAIPSLDDPWVMIMSSFQETTSSGQSTKARDMLSAYERIQRVNSRYGEGRVFVNFVDGGGWLARKRDLERLVNNCHYFINFYYLDMLKAIIHKHVPQQYFKEV